MNSEAEKNPVLNIRQELEELRDIWELMEYSHRKVENSPACDGIAMGTGQCVSDLDALLQRIPEGWGLRPELSLPVITPIIQCELLDTGLITHKNGKAEWCQEAVDFVAILQRAMWDAAGEEKDDGNG